MGQVYYLYVCRYTARLAQSVEHETLNLRVVGSSPTLGDQTFFYSTTPVSEWAFSNKIHMQRGAMA